MKKDRRPKVGVAAIVIKCKKVLLGKRKEPDEPGSWSLPGGHLEFGESFEECAKREVFEEAGIRIRNVGFATLTNDIFREKGKHYVTVFMIAEYKSGKARVMEPDRCEEWGWFEWDKMPRPLFLPVKNLLKSGFSPFYSEGHK